MWINMNKPNEDSRDFHFSATCQYQNFCICVNAKINGPIIDEYSFQEKAPNSYDLRDH